MLTAKLEMCVDNKDMVIQYNINTGSDGNIMPCSSRSRGALGTPYLWDFLKQNNSQC